MIASLEERRTGMFIIIRLISIDNANICLNVGLDDLQICPESMIKYGDLGSSGSEHLQLVLSRLFVETNILVKFSSMKDGML